jgi:hypothetical protein
MWNARRTARIVFARVCVYVVHVVRAAHRAPRASCARVCVRVLCAWCAQHTARVVR